MKENLANVMEGGQKNQEKAQVYQDEEGHRQLNIDLREKRLM